MVGQLIDNPPKPYLLLVSALCFAVSTVKSSAKTAAPIIGSGSASRGGRDRGYGCRFLSFSNYGGRFMKRIALSTYRLVFWIPLVLFLLFLLVTAHPGGSSSLLLGSLVLFF